MGVCKCCGCCVAALAVIAGLVHGGHLSGCWGGFARLADEHGNLDKVGLSPALWGGKMWNYEYSMLPDLSRKVVLVTGANSGVGFWTALHLARRGANVHVGCRSKAKCDEAVRSMKSNFTQANVEPAILDVSSLKSVRNFAEQFLAKTDRLDVLVLNAGIASSSADRSEDDIEPVFATNHVGHQLLYTLLESRILATGEESGDARVVVAASAKHYSSYGDGVALSRADLNGRYDEESGKAGGQVAYPQSKLANVLFTQEVARRMACKPVFANSVHPGAVSTEIWGNAKNEMDIRSAKDDNTIKMAGLSAVLDYFKESMWTPEEGALTQVYLAAAADIKERDIRGRYFHPQAVETQPCQRHAHNLKLQKALWSFTEELIAGRG